MLDPVKIHHILMFFGVTFFKNSKNMNEFFWIFSCLAFFGVDPVEKLLGFLETDQTLLTDFLLNRSVPARIDPGTERICHDRA